MVRRAEVLSSLCVLCAMDSILGLSADTLVTSILRNYFRVPSSSQPLLTDLPGTSEPGFHEHRRRHANRKGSLESSPLENGSEVDSEANFLASPLCLVNVELPSVKEAERLHPLLMELDATPYLELDNSNSVSNDVKIPRQGCSSVIPVECGSYHTFQHYTFLIYSLHSKSVDIEKQKFVTTTLSFSFSNAKQW